MKKITLVTLFIFGCTAIRAQQTISIEADGNLEAPNPCGCIELSAVTNQNNPAEILIGMGKCIELKQFDKAAGMFAIAGVYGKFDTFRVKDKTAHQALLVLQQNILLNIDESARNTFIDSLKKMLKTGSTELSVVCQTIQKIGMPKYYPKYMVQHGIQAFTASEGNGLTEPFDSAASWNLALKNYLHCGE